MKGEKFCADVRLSLKASYLKLVWTPCTEKYRQKKKSNVFEKKRLLVCLQHHIDNVCIPVHYWPKGQKIHLGTRYKYGPHLRRLCKHIGHRQCHTHQGCQWYRAGCIRSLRTPWGSIVANSNREVCTDRKFGLAHWPCKYIGIPQGRWHNLPSGRSHQ